ncbi:hypothetical protein C8F01DRAFT_1246116 [Mycena amicta]|nr:hypothetical protein C8F01DRAFT_1246116 [Mycena amicta]
MATQIRFKLYTHEANRNPQWQRDLSVSLMQDSSKAMEQLSPTLLLFTQHWAFHDFFCAEEDEDPTDDYIDSHVDGFSRLEFKALSRPLSQYVGATGQLIVYVRRKPPTLADKIGMTITPSRAGLRGADFVAEQNSADTRFFNGELLGPDDGALPVAFHYDAFIQAQTTLETMDSWDELQLREEVERLYADPDDAIVAAHELALKAAKYPAEDLRPHIRRLIGVLGTVLFRQDKLTAGEPVTQAAQAARKLHIMQHSGRKLSVDDRWPCVLTVLRHDTLTIIYMTRINDNWHYGPGQSIRLIMDGTTAVFNELHCLRLATFLGTIGKLGKEIATFLAHDSLACPFIAPSVYTGPGPMLRARRLIPNDPRVLAVTLVGTPGERVLKFISESRYGAKAQRLAGHWAPALEVYRPAVAGYRSGYYIVVMEFITGGLPGPTRDHIPALNQLLTTFKNLGIVHGDLRPQNLVFLPDGAIKVIDWDWAAMEPDGSLYPFTMNPNPAMWAPGQQPGKPMKHEHDIPAQRTRC